MSLVINKVNGESDVLLMLLCTRKMHVRPLKGDVRALRLLYVLSL